ncbi:MAG TPA: 50S ribosomal protein L10 [Candidatus Vogelbacteria bacterium]|nr:50S ribosomal protein L10 [Candidatus Vogelbacteria bacterium]
MSRFFFTRMAISREKKGEILERLKGIVERAVTVVFVNFHGLRSQDTSLLRRNLRENGVSYTVAKKTLIALSLATTPLEGVPPALDGEVGIAYGDDALAPAREVGKFAKSRKDTLRILGGIFEGSYRDALSMLEIANIPGREVLHGRLAYLVQSPLSRLVMALDQIAQKRS